MSEIYVGRATIAGEPCEWTFVSRRCCHPPACELAALPGSAFCADHGGEERPLDDADVIYFVQAEEGGPVKIGRTKDPKARLASLQTGSAVPLVVRRLFAGGARAEAEIHERLDDYRLGGEWFSPSRDVAAVALAIGQNGNLWIASPLEEKPDPDSEEVLEHILGNCVNLEWYLALGILEAKGRR